jgi:hypothetical protein
MTDKRFPLTLTAFTSLASAHRIDALNRRLQWTMTFVKSAATSS